MLNKLIITLGTLAAGIMITAFLELATPENAYSADQRGEEIIIQVTVGNQPAVAVKPIHIFVERNLPRPNTKGLSTESVGYYTRHNARLFLSPGHYTVSVMFGAESKQRQRSLFIGSTGTTRHLQIPIDINQQGRTQ